MILIKCQYWNRNKKIKIEVRCLLGTTKIKQQKKEVMKSNG